MKKFIVTSLVVLTTVTTFASSIFAGSTAHFSSIPVSSEDNFIENTEDFGEFILDEYYLNNDFTVIEISMEEAQLMDNGSARNSGGTIVGGTLVIPGSHDAAERNKIKRNFINNNSTYDNLINENKQETSTRATQ